ncbi:MAG: type I glyceraldehyde-3-phosphate dehydrogenase [Methanomicrobia archaeon]|nr:type I glyceraldehyde-3-phosphate dehydrogenase [Methanomicrobia archaeon]
MMKVAINGWGRIGRILFRAALQNDSAFEVVAINSRGAEASWVAHLLKYDSVHGIFNKPVEANAKKNALVVNGKEIPIFAETDLEKMPWADLAVDLVVESTGAFRDRKNASKHLTAGSKKVLITAPGKDPDVTIVPGVNDEMYDHAAHKIISLASCTTNCLAPVAKILNDEFGIIKGFMTTVHSYTNDQKILDGRHKDLRRARAAAMSIIPTTTGAAKALGVVLPALDGKLDGFALRVPTFNVSIVDLVTVLKRDTTADEVNSAFDSAAKSSLKGKLAVSHEPLVSIDYIGNNYSSIVDAEYTTVIGGRGNLVKVLSWYDNEWGYSCRCVDMMNRIANLGL